MVRQCWSVCVVLLSLPLPTPATRYHNESWLASSRGVDRRRLSESNAVCEKMMSLQMALFKKSVQIKARKVPQSQWESPLIPPSDFGGTALHRATEPV